MKGAAIPAQNSLTGTLHVRTQSKSCLTRMAEPQQISRHFFHTCQAYRMMELTESDPMYFLTKTFRWFWRHSHWRLPGFVHGCLCGRTERYEHPNTYYCALLLISFENTDQELL